MQRIIVATQNAGKIKEIKSMLEDIEVEVLTMGEAGIDTEVDETGTTFEENAALKANEISKLVEGLVIADDSGLEIDYLNKEPGVYSARYLGKDTPYVEKNQIILDRLKGVSKEARSARFVCAMCLSENGKPLYTSRGTIEGYIGEKIEGEGGFGYDPIFFVEHLGTSLANITSEEKNKISHRAKALNEMVKYIKMQLKG